VTASNGSRFAFGNGEMQKATMSDAVGKCSNPLQQPTQNAPVVLLVEDENVVREITGQVLTHAGYDVLESNGPREALRVASGHPGKIDLLLTDVVMPEMNGVELADRLQNLQPDLITILMSGYAECDVLRKITSGSAMHIQKPFTIDTLLARVAEALNGNTSRRGLGARFYLSD
jgi:two-component system, cell cycle sensor histidine kinase and response regulator CckA